MEHSIIHKNKQKFGEIEEILDDVEKSFKKFKKFDRISRIVLDHHRFIKLANGCSSLFSSSEKPHSFSQRIKKETILLKENLPDSILIRVYEQIDLMRAVIINPPDSPFYSHGLFFFDIFFPSNYPSCPPDIKYLDDVLLKMVPNLDVIREWDDSNSILDILIAIKDRIFNAKPYSSNDSRSYISSESILEVVKYVKKALFMNHERMIYMMRRPPLGFEVFVEGYFRTRAHSILLSYENCLADVGGDNELVLLFEKLIEAFERNGTYCKHHYVHVNKFRKEVQQTQLCVAKLQQSKDKASGFYWRTMMKLKNISTYLD